MDKIQILGLKKDLQRVIAFLQESGEVQIDEVKVDEENSLALESLAKQDHNSDYDVAQVDFALKLLGDYAKKRPIWAGKPTLSIESAKGTIENFDYKKVIEECENLEESFNSKKNDLASLEDEKRLLTEWIDLPFDLHTPLETESSIIQIGIISANAYDTFKKELHETSELTSVRKITGDKAKVKLSVVYTKEIKEEIKLLFGKHKFQEVALPVYEMSVAERIDEIEKKTKKLAEGIKDDEKKFKKLAEDYENLQIVHDVLVWEKDNVHVHEKLKGTEFSFIIEGWVAKLDRKELEEGLNKIGTVAVETLKLEEDEQAPIYLHNKKAAWPFESVTKLYGFPKANEVDPTPFLAIFFIVFFGLCLTDAGYGLTLFIIMFAALKFFKLPKESLGLIKLLMWGGLVTMVAGVLFGGYFGLTVDQAPSFMVAGESFKGQIINASAGNGPLTFLILALVLGIVHVIFGIMVDGYWKIKQKQYMDALLDSGLWIYFISVLLSWALAKAGILVPAAAGDILLYFVLAGVALLILTQGRKQKGIVKKVGIGVLSLYNLVGYFGDVLSYSRIMALGLGTGIIAFAMNTIAGLAYEMIPYVGFIFAGAVLLAGHLLNLVLSALGAFIHSARLQFVEFFSKFMEGGGSEFKPFKRECKYIIIK